MKRSNKKGFTVVELVIVIAIIAILAAVLIPTFAGLIQKANESKDTQLVKNLNTALAADNKEHKTMKDALDAAVAFGYDVGKINASATDNEILWDSVNDLFCYYNKSETKVQYIPNFEPAEGNTPATYQLWKIYDGKNGNTVPAYQNQTYSIYWAGEEAPSVTEVKVGFDVGNCPVAFALTYNNTGSAKNVVIRTNGSDLEINAPNDDVKHFGIVNNLTITAVNSLNCYHEYGYLINLDSFGTGKFKVEAGAQLCQSLEYITTKVGEDNFAQKGNASQYEQESPLKPAAIEVTQSNYTTVFTPENTEYILVEDIELQIYNITIPENCVVNLYMDGHDIINNLYLDPMYAFLPAGKEVQIEASAIHNCGSLTIIGEGNIGKSEGWFSIYNEGTLVLDGCSLVGSLVNFAEEGVTVAFSPLYSTGTIYAEGYKYYCNEAEFSEYVSGKSTRWTYERR